MFYAFIVTRKSHVAKWLQNLSFSTPKYPITYSSNKEYKQQ